MFIQERLKRMDDRTPPCFTPLLIEKSSLKVEFQRTRIFCSLYNTIKKRKYEGLRPLAYIHIIHIIRFNILIVF